MKPAGELCCNWTRRSGVRLPTTRMLSTAGSLAPFTAVITMRELDDIEAGTLGLRYHANGEVVGIIDPVLCG